MAIKFRTLKKREYINAKLLPLKEVLTTQKYEERGMNKSYTVYHSSHRRFASLGVRDRYWPQGIIKVYLYKVREGRHMYRTDIYGDQTYYDEWFEWIGTSPEHIPAELWSIKDW